MEGIWREKLLILHTRVKFCPKWKIPPPVPPCTPPPPGNELPSSPPSDISLATFLTPLGVVTWAQNRFQPPPILSACKCLHYLLSPRTAALARAGGGARGGSSSPVVPPVAGGGLGGKDGEFNSVKKNEKEKRKAHVVLGSNPHSPIRLFHWCRIWDDRWVISNNRDQISKYYWINH